jgi:hypothetical protein
MLFTGTFSERKKPWNSDELELFAIDTRSMKFQKFLLFHGALETSSSEKDDTT